MFSPTGEAIFTDIEATYKASLLKKKANSLLSAEALSELHDQAVNTLEVLTMNMIATDISLEHIFEYYKEITRENVIKLLLRCKKMYEARNEVKKILTLIIRKEALFKWISNEFKESLKQTDYPLSTYLTETECQRIYDCKRMLDRVICCLH